MQVEFHPEAQEDFDEAFGWYAKREISAAIDFAQQVDRAILRIKAAPHRFAKVDSQHRRCLLDQFPYHVVYRYTEELIEVIAVAHGARRPRFWRGR